MIRNQKIDKLCLICISLAVILTATLTAGCIFFPSSGKGESPSGKGESPPVKNPSANAISTDYIERIFDDTIVHEIDILLPQVNWDYMVKFAEDEQYVLCSVVIDGETIENAAIRPKGNSSLVAIKSQGSDHFSFKIEFDHYRKGNTFHGLDKLALNNLGQDVSCMKDYLSYQMMNAIGIPAPLTSYAHLKLNGEDFGLYLAVESIEDSFVQRNYGDTPGNIYKPEPFVIDTVTPGAFLKTKESPFEMDYSALGPGDRADILGHVVQIPFDAAFGDLMKAAALKNLGDEEAPYQLIFDSSVFTLTKENRRSLIRAIRKLNTEGQTQEAVDLENVIRYFIVHNFINNYDGYTGIFVHNYYLREQDEKLSLIPWDYNLGFGIFTFETAVNSILGADSPYQVKPAVGNAMDDKTSMVNYPIDTPTFTVNTEDRPLLAAVLNHKENLQKYHQIFGEFLDDFFSSGTFEALYQRAWSNIAPYIADGQTFYSYERFQAASQAVHDYCVLREESIRRQLSGALPSTLEGQRRDYANLVDASDLNLASSVTFDSLVFGIRSEHFIEILDAIAGENEHNSNGVAKSLAQAGEDHSQIPKILLRILTSSTLLKSGILSAVSGPVWLIISLIVLCIARKKIRKYSRRQELSKEKTRRKKNAVSS